MMWDLFVERHCKPGESRYGAIIGADGKVEPPRDPPEELARDRWLVGGVPRNRPDDGRHERHAWVFGESRADALREASPIFVDAADTTGGET